MHFAYRSRTFKDLQNHSILEKQRTEEIIQTIQKFRDLEENIDNKEAKITLKAFFTHETIHSFGSEVQ